MKHITDHHNLMLSTLKQSGLSYHFLEQYCQVIQDSGAPSQVCWGFVNGTLVNICIPGKFHRLLFSEDKRIHAVKFQSVVTPNRLIEKLFGPNEGKKDNTAMLRKSKLLGELRQFSHSAKGN